VRQFADKAFSKSVGFYPKPAVTLRNQAQNENSKWQVEVDFYSEKPSGMVILPFEHQQANACHRRRKNRMVHFPAHGPGFVPPGRLCRIAYPSSHRTMIITTR
jgi:hypothetical protein